MLAAMNTEAPLRTRSLFHFAFNVTDLDTARRFYGGVLGCREGRSTDTWVDFDFFSHQISLHRSWPIGSRRPASISFCPRRCGLKASRASSGRCSSATRLATRSR